MKQKNPATKNQRYLAIFLAATMLLSAGAMFFSGGSENKNSENLTPESGENNITLLSFSQIPGKQVHHQFNSIADGLNMSPEGVIDARFVDLQKVQGTPLEAIFGNITAMQPIYKADVTKSYGAIYDNKSGFELHQIPEQKIPAPWSVVPYNNYNLLERTNGTMDVWNVVGNPVIFGPRDNVENVIDILEGNATSTTEYNQILSQVDSKNAIYQEVVKTDNNTSIADQLYMDFKKLDDGSYTQTSVYLNPKTEFTEKIQTLQANSTERGVTYNVTTSGNITKLTINSDFRSLLNETQLLSQ
jgi:hypothetical protein